MKQRQPGKGSTMKKFGFQAGTAMICLLAALSLTGCPLFKSAWFRYFGSNTGDDAAYAIALAEDKGCFIAGMTEYHHAESDRALILKLSAGGLEEWRAEFDDGGDDAAMAVAALPDGGCIFAGNTAGDSEEEQHVFLCRLDAEGSEVWTKTISSENQNHVVSLDIMTDGGLAMSMGEDALGESSVVLVKFDADGNEQWRVTAADSAHTADAIATADGGAAIAWWSIAPADSVEGSPLTFTGGAGLLKTDSGGTIVQAIDIPLEEPVIISGLAETEDGFILAGQSSFNQYDATGHVFKIDRAGNILWNTALGEEGRDMIHDVIVTDNGHIAVAGEYGIPGGQPQMYLALLDADGALIWERVYGEADHDAAHALAQLPGGFILAGVSESEESEYESEHHEILVIRTNARGRNVNIEEDPDDAAADEGESEGEGEGEGEE
jgi:hypothetical protein